MKNLPKTIYLQVDPDDLSQEELSQLDFSDLEEVTWCETNQYDNDIEYTLTWHGADVVPPTPLFRVIGDDGRIYRWYCNGWYVKGEHSRWDKWEVKAPNKWRYPEPKKIEK